MPPAEGAPAGTKGRKTDMRFLIEYLAKHLLREREELFREGETVYVRTDDGFADLG